MRWLLAFWRRSSIMPAPPDMLGVLVLAAGASRRFGPDDKLLADLDGQPVAGYAMALAAGLPARRKLAVVSSARVADLARLAGLDICRIAPGGGMSDSLKAGMTTLSGEVDRVLILLGDMPWIAPADLDRLLACGAPACALRDGQRMPPALLPEEWFARVMRLEGDRGAGMLLRDIPADKAIAIPDRHRRDIDFPADIPTKAQGKRPGGD